MNAPDTLRAAAHMLNNRTNPKIAAALARLLQNCADDIERNVVIWQRVGQDVPALVEKYYGVYLAVAKTVVSARKPAQSVDDLPQPHKTSFRYESFTCTITGRPDIPAMGKLTGSRA
ncbi:MAG: hypothetical protein JOZ09_17555 [Pseudonocardiales bacterium]|nr:hypothetical protein [Pseudonocardiales bacterium]